LFRHGDMGPFEGTLFRVNADERTSEFTHFNLAIRLRKSETAGLTVLHLLRCPTVPAVL